MSHSADIWRASHPYEFCGGSAEGEGFKKKKAIAVYDILAYSVITIKYRMIRIVYLLFLLFVFFSTK